MTNELKSWQRKAIKIPLERESENFEPYIGRFRIMQGEFSGREINSESNLALLRWRHKTVVDPITNVPYVARERALAYVLFKEGWTAPYGFPVMLPCGERLFFLSELSKID